MSATNVVDLNSAGAINQTGGSLVAGTLTGSAATSASLTQPANQLDTLGAFSTTAGFALVNNKSLLVAGPVQDTGGASTLALTTRTGDITLAGNVSATNVVDLNSAGAIVQTGGSLAARTLTGSAGSSAGATLTSDNAISFFGPFTATSGVIDLVDSIPLTINGALTARLIVITATGSISLASDITTGGLASFTTRTDRSAGQPRRCLFHRASGRERQQFLCSELQCSVVGRHGDGHVRVDAAARWQRRPDEPERTGH